MDRLERELRSNPPVGWQQVTYPLATSVKMKPLLFPDPDYSTAFSELYFENFRLRKGPVYDQRKASLMANGAFTQEVVSRIQTYWLRNRGIVSMEQLDRLFVDADIQEHLKQLDPRCYIAQPPATRLELDVRQIPPEELLVLSDSVLDVLEKVKKLDPPDVDPLPPALVEKLRSLPIYRRPPLPDEMLVLIFSRALKKKDSLRARDVELHTRRVWSSFLRVKEVGGWVRAQALEDLVDSLMD